MTPSHGCVVWIGNIVRRAAGIAFGLGTQALFAVTVCGLFLFLRDGSSRIAADWLAVDCLLALQFAVVHSLLLLPSSGR